MAQTVGQPVAAASAAAGWRAGPGADPAVIAVDGPSGSGKSTAARGAAMALGLRYLDTGAMYRGLTWWMLEHGIDLADAESVIKHGLGVPIEVGTDPAAQYIKVAGVDVTAQIRQRPVTSTVSLLAAIPRIREHLISMQRSIIRQAGEQGGGIVAEGRDIGTVVAPEAMLKVFLTASEQVRAERRAAEAGQLLAVPSQSALPSAEITRIEQARRDQLDAPQTQRAADAVEIDATDLALPDVIALIVGLARSRRAGT